MFYCCILFPCSVFQVEELMIENKEAEEEISRWREACEMEVEAGKKAINEHKELVSLHGQPSSFYFYLRCFLSSHCHK